MNKLYYDEKKKKNIYVLDLLDGGWGGGGAEALKAPLEYATEYEYGDIYYI